jgi:hypothetical protein
MTNPGTVDLAHYFPAWLNNLADDATLEGSMMDGFVQGSDTVRTVVAAIRELYDYQEFNSVGPYGENGWIEDYTAGVHGRACAARRGQLPPPEHTAGLVPAAGREVRRLPDSRALRYRRA